MANATFHDTHELCPLRGAELGGIARRLSAHEPVRSIGVEAHHPVANDLPTDPAGFGRLGPASSIIDHSQRQKPPSLIRVPARPREPLQIRRSEVPSKRQCPSHACLLPFSTESQRLTILGIPCASQRYRKLV